MTEPTLSVEIIVIQVSDRILYITTHNPDEAIWVEQIAPKYGHYFPPSYSGHHTLFVAEDYDVEAVMRYLIHDDESKI